MKGKIFIALLFIVLSFLRANAQLFPTMNQQKNSHEYVNNNNTTSDASNGLDPSSAFLELSGGVNFPTGRIHEYSNTSSDWSGYASAGFDLTFFGGLPLYKHIGIAAEIGFYDNPYRINTFIASLNNVYPDNYSGYFSNSYTQETIMLGGLETFKLHKVLIDARLLLGVIITNYPNPNWITNDSNGISHWSVNVSQTSAFAFDFGFGLRYPIHNKVYGLVSLNFLYADPLYNGNIVGNNSVSQVSQLISGDMDELLITLNIGIGVQLGRL